MTGAAQNPLPQRIDDRLDILGVDDEVVDVGGRGLRERRVVEGDPQARASRWLQPGQTGRSGDRRVNPRSGAGRNGLGSINSSPQSRRLSLKLRRSRLFGRDEVHKSR